jgi:hypothetical protein
MTRTTKALVTGGACGLGAAQRLLQTDPRPTDAPSGTETSPKRLIRPDAACGVDEDVDSAGPVRAAAERALHLARRDHRSLRSPALCCLLRDAACREAAS